MKPYQCTLTDSKDRLANCYWQNHYLTKGYVLAYGEGSVIKWFKIKKGEKVIWNEKRLAYMLGDREVILCRENGIDFVHMHGGCNTEKEITYK